MCFSPQASFVASAGLLAIGAIAVTQSKTAPQRILACMPLVFSFQQFSEGLLWVSLSNTAYSHWRHISMYVFLVFAQVVWPCYVPITMILFERDTRRRKMLWVLSAIGIITSLYFLYCLMFYNVSVLVERHHIKYELNFPWNNRWFNGITYILAAVLSPFISSRKPLRFWGVGLLVAYLATKLLYNDYLVSIWCFSAAILSIFILLIIKQIKRQGSQVD